MRLGSIACAVALALSFAAKWARAQDYPPGQPTAPDTGRAFAIAPASSVSDSTYGIAHGGGSIAIANVCFSGGLASFTLEINITPWTARRSEGVFCAEITVERLSDGCWTGDVEGYSGVYGVNVNSGTPTGGGWSWSKSCQNVAPGTQFRAFGYCYMYNQGGGAQGEYALYSWMGPVTVQAPVPMTPPSSADSAATYGLGWTPAVSGGEGTGVFEYCVVGQTNFESISTPWIPPAAGVYSFCVGQMPDGTNTGNVVDPRLGEMEVNPVPYQLTVNPAQLAMPTSANATIAAGQSWTPIYYGGMPGAGPFVFAVVGQTNFGTSPTSLTGSWTPFAAGDYLFCVGQQAGSSNYSGNVTDPNIGPMAVNPTRYTLTVNPVNPPAVTISPSSASVAVGDSVAFTAGNGLNGYVWSVSPAGPAGISGNGASQTFTFTASGNYTVSVYSPAGGSYMRSNTASALVSSNLPQYTLTTAAVGNGSVTAGGTYPANTILLLSATPGADATFAGWTGSLSSQSNPLSVTLTGDLMLYGNFDSRQSQMITFVPPTKANYPGPPIILTATATSGLPVAFTILNGPASLDGSLLCLTGAGPVSVQASQAGDALWLPAASVTGTINAGVPSSIARIRFHSAGRDATRSVPGPGSGASSLWTDPTGLQASPWPSFAFPNAADPGAPNSNLPAVPPAPSLSP